MMYVLGGGGGGHGHRHGGGTRDIVPGPRAGLSGLLTLLPFFLTACDHA
jgi:hypothetical protein